MTVIRVGSRDSALATAQAQAVINTVNARYPHLSFELVTMKTTGDIILDRTLDKIGGKGLFVKELDAALLNGLVDITVHSCKDIPAEINPRLPLVAFSRREDFRDVLVLPEGVSSLQPGKPMACSSLRRQAQLRNLFPDFTFAPVRGNVLTRLRKLDSGEFSALVLAAAGLVRLGLEHRISRFFTTEEILPAACQGIIAVQTAEGTDVSWLDAFNDPDSSDCAAAERAFIKRLDGGCASPTAAFAQISGSTITIRGFYPDSKGSAYHSVSGPRSDGAELGSALAQKFLEVTELDEQ